MTTQEIESVIASSPSFYHGYIREAGSGDIVSQFAHQIEEARHVFFGACKGRETYRYAAGKWTPMEILGHLIDAERVFIYRAMRFSRNDKTDLPGFEEDEYIAATDFNRRGMDNLMEEFVALRGATIALYKGLTEEEKWRGGTANGNPISVYALFMSTLGHFNHHVRVIKERYLHHE